MLPAQSPKLLQALHLLTRDGHLNADALRKLKQVNHLVGLLTPALDDLFARYDNPIIVDAGSGNGYLGFVLYELFLKPSSKGQIVSIESRPELTAKAKLRADQLGFERMTFETCAIEAAKYPERINLLTALHACDTATDEALIVALSQQADYVAVVPCCQAEVAQQLKEGRIAVPESWQMLFHHPWHRREFGSHLTNVIRALVLESHGYRVTVTELTGWEHSLKNEFILGRKIQQVNNDARKHLNALLEQVKVSPKLIRAQP